MIWGDDMAKYDLEAMSLRELEQLQKEVAKAISTLEMRRKAEARARIEELAREMGYPLAELVGAESGIARRKQRPGVARYRNPENPSDTWSGRGRKPRWFVAALDAGRRPEDMLVG